jgi:hypothetical protein
MCKQSTWPKNRQKIMRGGKISKNYDSKKFHNTMMCDHVLFIPVLRCGCRFLADLAEQQQWVTEWRLGMMEGG